MNSRHNHDITGLKFDVLLQILAVDDVVVVERQGDLSGGSAAENNDVIQRRKGGAATRHAQCLHNIHTRVDHKVPGLGDLPNNVNLVALDLLHRHRDNW